MSMVVVYDTDDKMLVLSHLIASDCLPAESQIDENIVSNLIKIKNYN